MVDGRIRAPSVERSVEIERWGQMHGSLARGVAYQRHRAEACLTHHPAFYEELARRRATGWPWTAGERRRMREPRRWRSSLVVEAMWDELGIHW